MMISTTCRVSISHLITLLYITELQGILSVECIVAIILYKSAQTIHKSVNQQQQHYDKFISPKRGR